MQNGIGEDGVEGLVRIGQLFGGALVGLHAACARRRDHLRRGINARYACARGSDSLRELAIAAAEVENALAGLRSEPLERAGASAGTNAAFLSVGLRGSRFAA